MKFTMLKKETKDEKYANNPFFKHNKNGNLICSNITVNKIV